MTSHEIYALSPLIVLSAASVAVMIGITIRRSHLQSAAIALAGLLGAIVLLPGVAHSKLGPVTPLLTIDRFGLFYMGLIFAAAAVVVVQSYGYLKRRHARPEEFYILLLIATAGAAVITISARFASFYLGLECLSVSLYAMIGYLRDSARSTEAGIKYLILAAGSAAFLLFGMALVYAQLGTMDFAALVRVRPYQVKNGLVMAGFGMMLVGIGFKLSIVPFHMWTPDVYEGAPAPVTGFVATVSKAAIFGLMLRYFTSWNPRMFESIWTALAIMAVASMIMGNLLALLQTNVKRILAYSSIAHLGYIIVAFLAGRHAAVEAVTCYLVAYMLTTLAAFGVVATLSTRGEHREMDALEDYQGLFWTRPWLAGAFTIMLLSLAGIPLTAGFIAKFYVLSAGVGSQLWWLLAVLVATSVIGLFYYLRVVVAMYAKPAAPRETAAESGPVHGAFSLSGTFALAVLTLTLIGLGVYPSPLLNILQTLTLGGKH